MEDDLIAAHGDCEKLMPYLHLPVQAGSDRVLKAMNRKHTAESYIRLIERIRAARPDPRAVGRFHRGLPRRDGGGFPGDAEPGRRKVGYASAYSFKYSPRPGTPPPNARRSTPPRPTTACSGFRALLTSQQRAAQNAMVGRTVSVLFEKPGRMDGQMVGKSEYLHAVHVQGPSDLSGRIAPVEIVESGPNSLAGVLKMTRVATAGHHSIKNYS